MKTTVTRYHDFSMGHAVTGHKLIDENGNETLIKGGCYNLHGHNYRFYFTIESTLNKLDNVGRILDFNAIKAKLCTWLEQTWDHKFLINKDDERAPALYDLNPEGVRLVDFNPTAENIGAHILNTVAPKLLVGTNTQLIKISVEETRKCSATVEL